MLIETQKHLPVYIAVCSAAVSDYVPINYSKKKMKKKQKFLTMDPNLLAM